MAMLRCPHCGAMANGDMPFCPSCGMKLSEQNRNETVLPADNENETVLLETPPMSEPTFVRPEPTRTEPLGNGTATAGMVLGIIAAALMSTIFMGVWLHAEVLSWLGALEALAAMPLALTGLGLSIGGVCRRNRPKGKAVAGFALSISVLLAWSLLISLYGDLAGFIHFYF